MRNLAWALILCNIFFSVYLLGRTEHKCTPGGAKIFKQEIYKV